MRSRLGNYSAASLAGRVTARHHGAMLGESAGTKGDATIEQIGRRRTFTRPLQLAVVLAVIQWPMRDAVHDAAGAALGCGVSG